MMHAIKAVYMISTIRRKDLITSHAELDASQERSPALQHSTTKSEEATSTLAVRNLIALLQSDAGACHSQTQQRHRGITFTASCEILAPLLLQQARLACAAARHSNDLTASQG